MVGAYFGRQRFATVQGWMTSFGSTGGLVGPVIAGVIFDVTGSYRLALFLLAAICLMASLVVRNLPRTTM